MVKYTTKAKQHFNSLKTSKMDPQWHFEKNNLLVTSELLIRITNRDTKTNQTQFQRHKGKENSDLITLFIS